MGAYLGYVGWVRFGSSTFIRATSADIKITQAVDKPDVVDGKIDKTVWTLGPQEVGGNVAFPAVYELYGGAGTLPPSSYLWNCALVRMSDGDMLTKPDVTVKYVDGVGFTYKDCIVDTYEISINHSETVNISTGLIGTMRNSDSGASNDLTLPAYNNKNTRAVTWKDCTVEIGGTNVDVASEEIRSFSCSIANNSQRIYTLNGLWTPRLILPTKRDITGSITIMGRNSSLSQRAYTNADRCKADNSVRFGYSTGGASMGTECGSSWFVNFEECVVFEIEELAISNELFQTTVNWHALPGIRYGSSLYNTNFVE
jgi:hypothetical protein